MSLSELTAVLFSGGKGSRLFPISEFYQKVMMPIGRKGIPLLEIVIYHLKYYGISNFIILLGYRGNLIKRYFGDGSRLGVNIKYSTDPEHMKGTGGALLNAKELCETKYYLIYFTDILTSLNLEHFFEFHQGHNKIGSIWVDPNWMEGPITVSYNSEGVASSLSSAVDKLDSVNTELVNTGISILDRKVFRVLEDVFTEKQELDLNTNLNVPSGDQTLSIDLSSEVFSRLVDQKEIKAYITDEWWLDIGSLSRLNSVSQTLLSHQLSHLTLEVDLER